MPTVLSRTICSLYDSVVDILHHKNNWKIILGSGLVALLVIKYRQPIFKHNPEFGDVFPNAGGLPIVGIIPFIVLSGKTTFQYCTYLSKRRRKKSFFISFARLPFFIINGYDDIKETLVKSSTAAAGRPGPETSLYLVNPEAKGILNRDYSQEFVSQRQACLQILRNFGFGKRSSEDRIQEEALALTNKLLEYDKPLNPTSIIQNSVANVICNMVFGSRYEYNNSIFDKLISNLNFMASFQYHKCIALYLPFMAKYSTYLQTNIKCQTEIIEFIQSEIDKNQEYLRNEEEQENFIYSYLKLMKEKSDDSSFSTEQLKFVVFDFFFGGTETTATAISWALIYLANRPELQRRLQEEIDRVIGDGVVSLHNKNETLLLDAFIQETLRISTPVPMTVLHKAIADLSVNGLHLPKGALFTANLHSVLHDETIFKEPETFNPDRFIQNDNILRPDELIPFGLGKRLCLGEQLAKQELYIFIASLIQRFEFSRVDEEKINESGLLGITYMPKDFLIVIKARS
ncbi:DgyrCDS12835 [Dimorphilus gyrociliatus]|uniref:DgyrCDS12835 n=1 Tax=Dimorphilus gyrociliatus TaxID=2664684 RepID=A0A7I8W8V4_9ANNE|nr:DgyrCDS12835 [Dimorphilus gyrociliatus]